jgi:hypothetical protein
MVSPTSSTTLSLVDPFGLQSLSTDLGLYGGGGNPETLMIASDSSESAMWANMQGSVPSFLRMNSTGEAWGTAANLGVQVLYSHESVTQLRSPSTGFGVSASRGLLAKDVTASSVDVTVGVGAPWGVAATGSATSSIRLCRP